MPNPFDQFDVKANPFDQFDKSSNVNQIPGLEGSVDPDTKLHPDESSTLDKVRGGVEAGVSAVTGIPAALAEAWAQKFGVEPGKVNAQFYQPRTEKGKEYSEDVGEFANRYLNPLLGGVGAAHLPVEPIEKPVTGLAADVLKKQAEIEGKPAINPFDQFDEAKQQSLFDINNQGEGANPYEAQQGHWVTDENGIPIRADLSMEAQNLQNPLQKNLWGDELAQRENPVGQAAQLPMDRDIMGFPKMTEDPRKMMENDVNLTQAIDNIAKDDPVRGEALDLLRGELDAPGELKSAKMEADTPTTERSPYTDPTIPFNYKNQGGGLFFGNPYKVAEKALGKTDMIPDDPNVGEAIKASYGAEKDAGGKLWAQAQSGGALTSIKLPDIPVVRAAADLVQNAIKRATLYERKNILPVEREYQNLSRKDLVSIAQLLKDENKNRRRLSPDAIEQLPADMQKAYAFFRDMMDNNIKKLNDTREAQGLKPVDPHEAYLAHMWEGDYRRPLYEAVLDERGNPKFDSNGDLQKKLVWYLAAHTKGKLEAQTSALMAQRPDLFFDPKLDHQVRFYKRQADIQMTIHQMIDTLGRDDPSVKRMLDMFGELTDKEAKNFLGQQKHFEPQTGVRGFIGDRPDTRGSIRKFIGGDHDFNEAISMMEHNFSYAKNSTKWAELQKAAPGIKEILTDARLREELPNALNYVREYWKNALGQSEARFISQLNDGLRDVAGVNSTQLHNSIGDMKSFFVVSKLMASTGYGIMNAVQSSMIVPQLVLWASREAKKGNWMTSIPVGNALGMLGAAKALLAYPLGIAEGTAAMAKHYVDYWAKSSRDIPQDTMGFYNRALRYSEDNGITTNSIYNGQPVGHAFNMGNKAVNMAGHTISAPEGLGRSIAFFTAVEFLRSSEKFKNDIDLFQEAERLTNAAIADHRTSERPIGFHKLGWIGDAFSTLQTWPINFINQWGLFGREALKGNLTPFAAALGIQYMLGGVGGLPIVRDIDHLYQWLKNNMLPTHWWMAAQENDFWRDPKVWLLKQKGGSAMLGGQISDLTGLYLTTRLSAPAGEELMQNPIAPYASIAKQLYHTGKAVYDPEKKQFFNRDSMAQAAMEDVPPGLQGFVENASPFEGSTYDWRTVNGQKQRLAMRPGNIDSHSAVYARTPQEDNLRYLGLRSNKEGIERDIGFRVSNDMQAAKERAQSLPDKFYEAIKTGNKDLASDYYKAYTIITGKGISDQQIEAQIKQNYMTTIERASTGAKSVSALKDVVRMQAMLKQIREEQGDKQ